MPDTQARAHEIERARQAENADPELVVGLVGAVGTGLSEFEAALVESLERVDYTTISVRISSLLRQIAGDLGFASGIRETPLEARYADLMNAGDRLRRRVNSGDAAALLAVNDIREKRPQYESKGISRRVYVIHSLKTPAEVETLRTIYGKSFLLLSVYAREEDRLDDLYGAIARSHQELPTPLHRREAEDLIARDLKDADEPLGQNVRDTFPLADVFIDVSDRQLARGSVDRFVDLIFGYPFHTPAKPEYAMFLAQAAALRSADLGRQVGAALAAPDGEVVALGTNEVPKAGGGQYWPGDQPDDRDFQRGYDSNAQHKREIIADTLRLLRKAGQFSQMADEEFDQFLYRASMGLDDSPLRGARLGNLIEFGRAVHAEMSAFMDAGRRGIPLKGLTLYTTTFPCHECARHIVAAGIERVIFVEPYPKSLAGYLHADAIGLEQTVIAGRVGFSPFVGIAPRLYFDVFAAQDRARKNVDGSVRQWAKKEAVPRDGLRRHLLLVDMQERVHWKKFLELFLPSDDSRVRPETAETDKCSIMEEVTPQGGHK